MSERFTYNFKTESLEEFNFSLLYTCNFELGTSLIKTWSELIDEYSFLMDFYSDYEEPNKEISEFLKKMDRINEIATVRLAYLGGIKNWVITCGSLFFKYENEIQKSILLHELGHVIVNERNLVGSLFSQYQNIEHYFNIFCSNINKKNKYYISVEKSIQDFFEFYIFDIIKIPGELYANLWVYFNCIKYFRIIIDNQFTNYKNINMQVRKNIKNRLLKHILIYLVLRLQVLLSVLKNDDELFDEITKYIEELLSELKILVTKKEYRIILKTKKQINKICYSLDDINRNYLVLFNNYLNNIKLKPQDFLLYP